MAPNFLPRILDLQGNLYTKIQSKQSTFRRLSPPFINLFPFLKLITIQMLSNRSVERPNAQSLTATNEIKKNTLRTDTIGVKAFVFFVE